MPPAVTSAFPDKVRADLRHIALMIGRAVNYIGSDGEDHGFRTAYIAMRCAEQLGWPAARREYIYVAGVLHNCGLPANADDVGTGDGKTAEPDSGPCIRGHEYAKHVALLRPFAAVIRHYRTPWTVLKGLPIPQPDRDAAALINLSAFADRLIEGAGGALDTPETVAAALREESGERFNKGQVEALVAVMADPVFWRSLRGPELQNLCANLGKDRDFLQEIGRDELRKLAVFLARLVDGKSGFTLEHSERVGLICEELGAEIGFDRKGQQELHTAGLLHDLGYVDAPTAAVLKDGALNAEEYSIIKQHVAKTRVMLERCFPGTRFPEWAANHHERLDGGGYPNHLSGAELDTGSRIVAIADIFQALGQPRPYRGRKNAEDVIRIMRAMVNDGQLDGDIFDRLAARRDYYYDLAAV
ncbi:HD domain-containing phosphohydrolase [Hwanghaeella sp.]|uniref:HD domain-containing phosphohydrolase n=1 Tax=Hwanghaeella sp. TaxID=2605943 RepID=UPI003CCBF28F